MPINTLFLAELDRTRSTAECKAANVETLDKLIKISLDRDAHFTKTADEAQSGVFSSELFNEKPGDEYEHNDNILPVFISETDQRLSDQQLEADRLELKRKAAEIRIIVGLPEHLIELKEMFSKTDNNELREWIASKPEYFGKHEWKKEPYLLDDNGLDYVRKQVAEKASLQLITKLEAAEQALASLRDIELASNNIASVIQKIQLISGSEQALHQEIPEHQEMLSEECRGLLQHSLQSLTENFSNLKAGIREKSINFIDTQHALQEAEQTNVATDSADAIQLALQATKVRLEAAEFALVLAGLTRGEEIEAEADEDGHELLADAARPAAPVDQDDDGLDLCREQKNNIERALIKLTIHHNATFINEKAAFIAQKLTEISQVNVPEPIVVPVLNGDVPAVEVERNRRIREIEEARTRILTLQGDAEAAYALILDKATENALKIEEATAGTLSTDADKTSFAVLNPAVQQALATAKNHLEDIRLLVTVPDVPNDFGNTFLEKDSFLDNDYFTTQVVLQGQAVPALAARPAPADMAVEQQHLPNGEALPNPKFQRLDLKAGDLIYSRAEFSKPVVNGVRPAEKIKVHITQDHTGKVTYKASEELLDPEQRILAALKQAEMLLHNFDPAKGNTLVITGDARYKSQATVLFAVLLRLKENCPAFKDINIVSKVEGCTGPVPATSLLRYFAPETQEAANKRFIAEHLSSNPQSEGNIHRLEEQLKTFSETKKVKIEELKTLKQRLREGRLAEDGRRIALTPDERVNLAREIKALDLNDNEEVDIRGVRTTLRR